RFLGRRDMLPSVQAQRARARAARRAPAPRSATLDRSLRRWIVAGKAAFVRGLFGVLLGLSFGRCRRGGFYGIEKRGRLFDEITVRRDQALALQIRKPHRILFTSKAHHSTTLGTRKK